MALPPGAPFWARLPLAAGSHARVSCGHVRARAQGHLFHCPATPSNSTPLPKTPPQTARRVGPLPDGPPLGPPRADGAAEAADVRGEGGGPPCAAPAPAFWAWGRRRWGRFRPGEGRACAREVPAFGTLLFCFLFPAPICCLALLHSTHNAPPHHASVNKSRKQNLPPPPGGATARTSPARTPPSRRAAW